MNHSSEHHDFSRQKLLTPKRIRFVSTSKYTHNKIVTKKCFVKSCFARKYFAIKSKPCSSGSRLVFGKCLVRTLTGTVDVLNKVLHGPYRCPDYYEAFPTKYFPIRHQKWSYYSTLCSVIQSCRSFLGRMHKFSINYEEILSRAHGNFQEQKKFLESSDNYN